MSDRRAAWALGLAVFAFYLCFHSTFYNFDGVACAIAVELGDLKRLVHGNHLAYGVVGRAFYLLWRALGYRGEALLTLQVLDSLLGAATCGVFYSALRGAGIKRPASAAAACGLAVSQAFWFWSLEAQVYPLGALFCALALRELLRERPRPALLGLFHGCAGLGHLGHAMLLPACVWALRKRKKDLLPYAAAAAAVLVAAYGLAAAFAVKPASVAELKFWLLGSAALNLNKELAWHGGFTAVGFFEWTRMAPRIFAEFVGLAKAPAALGLGLGLLALALAAAGAARAPKKERALAALWLGGYALLFLSWEPHTPVYRITDLLPLWLLLARLPPAAPAALAAALALFNGAFNILPRTDPARNADLTEARALGETLDADSWVVVTGQGQVYVPYFAHLRPLNMRYWEGRLPALEEHLATLEKVYVTQRTLDVSPWKGFFEGYGLEATRLPGVWRVRRTGSPKAE